MKSLKILKLCFLTVLIVMLGCATFPREEENISSSKLTTGTVKKEIIKGETTQAEVLNLFGSPNLVTMNSESEEVWNYNRMSYSTTSGSDGGSLIFWSGSRAMTTATTKSFDLIITFDKNDVVKNYNVISAAY